MVNKLHELLPAYAQDTENAEINYALAIEYEAIGQTATAISFFLRAAERTDKLILAYECMLKIGLCFERQGKRGNSARGAFFHAINILPGRPEAYFLLARFYERAGDHVFGYTYAQLGLLVPEGQKPLRSYVEYPGRYGLLFQKAVSAWWWGKSDESRKLFLDLWNKYMMDDSHKTAVEKNLKQLNVPYVIREFHSNVEVIR
jgi:tetratricopeptide (TPR) repeat protein